MTTATILGNEVRLVIELTDVAEQTTEIVPRFEEMAETVNAAAGRMSGVQQDTFRLTRTLTIFREKMFRGQRISRSFMDQREANFHWTLDEFVAWDPAPRRPTAYFHDAWHIHQFRTLGEPPNVEAVLIDREQDAMVQQLEMARILDCDGAMITFLTDFANDRNRIAERLRSGLGISARVEAHFLVFD